LTDKTTTTPDVLTEPIAHDFLNMLASVAIGGLFLILVVGITLYAFNVRGTFALFPAFVGVLVMGVGYPVAGWTIVGGCVLGGLLREFRRHDKIKQGGDKARRQRSSVGVIEAWRNRRERRSLRGELAVVDGRYPLGIDQRGAVTWLPLGLEHGRHSLLIGATGAGKTNTVMGTIHANLAAGCGVVAIDPKGDTELARRLRQAAYDLDRPFWHFSLDGPSHRWNPLANGGPTERADKLIGAEEWTEPHYKRLYQRYLLALFLAMHGRGDEPDLAKVVNLLYPDRLALYVREIQHAELAEQLGLYLGSMTAEETRDLAGLRNRLAILVEGEHRDLFSSEGDPTEQIDLLLAITQGAVVLFSLNSNSNPETAKLLGAAIFQDLKHVAGILETHPERQWPAAVVVDEFGAFGADHVLGLFQRARSAKLSLTLITQELADLQAVGPAFRDQVIGNVETIIAHRQSTPESAELVAKLGGTREIWDYTFQTEDRWPTGPADRSGLGSKRRGHEFYIGPDTIKALTTGEAIVITKNPHAVRHVFVYPNGGVVDSQPLDPATEAETRLAAYGNARPDLIHAWHHRN
jgi:conjugal transfer pilus assembly protein TraD